MIRDIKHLEFSESYIDYVTLGNRSGVSNNNTFELWFKISPIVTVANEVTFKIKIVNTYYHNDNAGITEFEYMAQRLNYGTNYYNYIVCTKSGATNYFTEIIEDKLVDGYVGIRFTLKSENHVTTSYFYYKHEHNNAYDNTTLDNVKLIYQPNMRKHYETKDYKNYPSMAYMSIKYVKHSDEYRCQALDDSKSWIITGCIDEFTAVKSISIPKWCSWVDISANDSSLWNQVSFTGRRDLILWPMTYSDYISKLTEDILMLGVRIPIDNPDRTNGRANVIANDGKETAVSFEDILVYDGEDRYYRYYHIKHIIQNTATVNNSIRIIASVKKKFRVKSSILSHLLIKYNKKEVA